MATREGEGDRWRRCAPAAAAEKRTRAQCCRQRVRARWFWRGLASLFGAPGLHLPEKHEERVAADDQGDAEIQAPQIVDECESELFGQKIEEDRRNAKKGEVEESSATTTGVDTTEDTEEHKVGDGGGRQTQPEAPAQSEEGGRPVPRGPRDVCALLDAFEEELMAAAYPPESCSRAHCDAWGDKLTHIEELAKPFRATRW